MDILELAERYDIDLQKQGDLFVGYCPFHDDKNRPNFTVYPKTNSYWCYTCSIGGDAIDFFARIEKISRSQAMQRLGNDLQGLIKQLNSTPEEVNYNSTTSLLISKIIHDFLLEHPHLIAQVISTMSDIDNRLSKDVDQKQAVEIVEDVVASSIGLDRGAVARGGIAEDEVRN